jgi:hypothetical protein
MEREGTCDWRGFLLEHISSVLLVALGLEMLFFVLLIVFTYLESSADDYFYLFSLLILMFSPAYFGWHSLVKENAFELLAFLVMSSLLSFHGLYKVLSETSMFPLQVSAVCVLSVCQVLYYLLFTFAYRHFGWRMVLELKTTNQDVIQAFRLFETFVSVMKIDFMLYTITTATFWFYLFHSWTSFLVAGISISAVVYVGLIVFSLVGIRAAFKEQRKPMVGFLVTNPLLSLFKAAFMIIVAAAPGSEVTQFVLVQSLLVAAIDVVIGVVAFILGLKLLRNFSRGLLTLINNIDKSLLVKPII